MKKGWFQTTFEKWGFSANLPSAGTDFQYF